MEGIAPDRVLGGRYAVTRRLAHRADLEHWAARDTTLERDVAVTVFDDDNPQAAAALDGARRAAGVEDARLIRILDVGSDDGLSWIIEEGLHDAVSLATLMQHGPLPADEARRIMGECASALEAARHRGLHHLRLSPYAVLRTREGGIKVSGVAVAAALDGYDDLSAAEASRLDTISLVALGYAALTATWPLQPAISGLEPAPRIVGGVPSPSELVEGVPNDLDTLCRHTLNEGDGPQTPGQLAGDIFPWAHEAVLHAGPGSARGSLGADPTTAIPTGALAGTPTAGPTAGQGSERTAYETEDPARGHDDWAGAGFPTPAGGFSLPEEELEPPLPLLTHGAPEPDRQQTGIVMVMAALLVVIALVLAFWGVSMIGRHPTNANQAGPLTSSSASPSSGGSSASSSGSPSSSSASSTSTAAKPLAITGASLINQSGTADHPELLPKAYDGDKSTLWQSSGYASTSWGGLKSSMGVAFDLGSVKTVHEVRITLPSTEGVSVYVGDEKKVESATKLDLGSGKTAIAKPAGGTVKGRYVIVYFTQATVPDGQWHRVELAEVSVK